MSKEPQPPLGGMLENQHIGYLAHIEDPMEEDIDVSEESQAQKITISMNNFVYDIVDQFHILKKMLNLTTF